LNVLASICWDHMVRVSKSPCSAICAIGAA
jgi:hypothetical protein